MSSSDSDQENPQDTSTNGQGGANTNISMTGGAQTTQQSSNADKETANVKTQAEDIEKQIQTENQEGRLEEKT